MNMANIITLFRILAALVILFVSPLTPAFFCIYLLGGVSDMIDGAVARMRGESSLFGSKLDTAADALFCLSVFIRLFPYFEFPLFIWIATGTIALVKVLSLLIAGGVVAEHTLLNKAAGAMLYLLPFVLSSYNMLLYLVSVLLISALAAGQEMYLVIRKARE